MSSQRPGLWWVYDSEDRAFSTLPTGPFLVPALIIACIAVLFRSRGAEPYPFAKRAGDLVHTERWQKRCRRFLELEDRYISNREDMRCWEVDEYLRLRAYMHHPHSNRHEEHLPY
jgi:hypothetical protein